MKKPLNVFLVPTGVGASIGGYAGDASCFARSLSEGCKLIVNPNVVNAAVFSGITPDMFYVEGYITDEFFNGKVALREAFNNKIGVIFDSAIPQDVLNVHINTINAVKTVYGIDVFSYEMTESPVGVEFFVNESGISSGRINNAQTLIDAAQKLKSKGAEALAVVCLFDDSEDESYESADGVDPVGGVEGIISHVLSRETMLPVAHAPAFSNFAISTKVVNSKAAAEYITPTFLPCILLGLNNAPQIVDYQAKLEDDYSVDDVKALIMPFNSLGSTPVLQAASRNIPIIAVRENKTVLDVGASQLGVDVVAVDTYQQAKEFLKTLQ